MGTGQQIPGRSYMPIVHIPVNALCNCKEIGTGIRVRGNPCRICVDETT